MTLLEKIWVAYPEIDKDYTLFPDTITLRDDADGKGAYIKVWEYDKPLTEELLAYYRP